VAEPGPQARALTSLDGPPIDFVSIARGLGVPAERVDTAEAMDAALVRALAGSGPSLIELTL